MEPKSEVYDSIMGKTANCRSQVTPLPRPRDQHRAHHRPERGGPGQRGHLHRPQQRPHPAPDSLRGAGCDW